MGAKWHTSSDRKRLKHPHNKLIEVSDDKISEDSCFLTNRYSELIDEALSNEQRLEETLEQNGQQIKATSQERGDQSVERYSQQLKSQKQVASEKRRLENQVSCEQGQQDGSNISPNSNETQQTDNRDKNNLLERDSNGNNLKSGESKSDSILIIGDSVIKHIDPKKLSRKKVHKFSYRGKTCEEISEAVVNIQTKIDPSHVVIHYGTNNLPTDSAEACATKIVNLPIKVRNKFPNNKVGVSGLTHREDIAVNPKRIQVNKKLQDLSVVHEFSYIDNSKIDNTCLNNSKLHLNDKGTSLLAVHFIKFIRGLTGSNQRSSNRNKGFQMALFKQLGEMLTKIGNLRVT